MNAAKTLIFACTCILALAAGQAAGASIPDPGAAGGAVTGAGAQRQRIQDLLAEQGLPSARRLAREITREIVGGDGVIPGRVMLRPQGTARLSVANAERRSRMEPARAAADTGVRVRRGGVLSSIRRGLSRILQHPAFSG